MCVATARAPTRGAGGNAQRGHFSGGALLVKRWNDKFSSFTNEPEVRFVFKYEVLVKIGPTIRPGLAGTVPV